jgi:hypothetical protein
MKKFLKDLKSYGYTNHLSSVLLILFLIYVAKQLKIQFNLFGFVYGYVACLFMGHYAAHNVEPTEKYKYDVKKGPRDTFIALPVVGAINILTYGIPIFILDYIFKIL